MAHPSNRDLRGITFDDMTENAVADFAATIHNLTIKRQFTDQCAQQARSKFNRDSESLPSNSPQLAESIRRIKIFRESSANAKEHIAEVEKHRTAFMKGIEKRRSDLNALGQYVIDDGKIYMAMNDKYNSRCTMITKKINSVHYEANFQKNIELCEKMMPRTAERMKTWDIDLTKATYEDN